MYIEKNHKHNIKRIRYTKVENGEKSVYNLILPHYSTIVPITKSVVYTINNLRDLCGSSKRHYKHCVNDTVMFDIAIDIGNDTYKTHFECSPHRIEVEKFSKKSRPTKNGGFFYEIHNDVVFSKGMYIVPDIKDFKEKSKQHISNYSSFMSFGNSKYTKTFRNTMEKMFTFGVIQYKNDNWMYPSNEFDAKWVEYTLLYLKKYMNYDFESIRINFNKHLNKNVYEYKLNDRWMFIADIEEKIKFILSLVIVMTRNHDAMINPYNIWWIGGYDKCARMICDLKRLINKEDLKEGGKIFVVEEE